MEVGLLVSRLRQREEAAMPSGMDFLVEILTPNSLQTIILTGKQNGLSEEEVIRGLRHLKQAHDQLR